MLIRRTIRGPKTRSFHIAVRTIRPRQGTSRGAPTLMDSNREVMGVGTSCGGGACPAAPRSLSDPQERCEVLVAEEPGAISGIPGLAEPRGSDVPVRANLPGRLAEVTPEVLDRGSAPIPVPVVDAVDHEPG